MTATNNKHKTGRRIIIIAVAVIAIAGGLFLRFSRNSVSGAEDGYTEAEALRMTIENTIESDGEITSTLEEKVLPHTSYYLETIDVKEGDALAEGDVILTYTNGYTMTAPYNCVVTGWDLPDEEDQLTSDHYVAIAGTDVLQMEISVSEDQIGKISPGDSATVTVEATGESYQAEVSYISQVGNYSGGSSSFTVKASFDNDGSLKLGMSGELMITIDKTEDAVAVPVDAVSTRGGKSFVTLAGTGEDTGTQTEVETGISNGSYIEIKSGLEEGDKVLVRTSGDSSSDDRSGMPGGMDGSGFLGGGPGGNGGSAGAPGGNRGNGGTHGGNGSGGGAPGGSGSGRGGPSGRN